MLGVDVARVSRVFSAAVPGRARGRNKHAAERKNFTSNGDDVAKSTRASRTPPPRANERRTMHAISTPVARATSRASAASCSTRRDRAARLAPRASRADATARADDDDDVDAARAASSSSTPTRRRLINLTAATTAMVVASPALAAASEFADAGAMAILNRQGAIAMSDDEWRAKLDPFAYQVLRREATERPFSSPLYNEKRAGTFVCAGCGSELFDMSTKYDSGTGWPSFYAPISADAVTEVPDYSIMFLPRTEVRCAKCQGHLGHVFNDGPRETTGLRYCMNGVSLAFEPAA